MTQAAARDAAKTQGNRVRIESVSRAALVPSIGPEARPPNPIQRDQELPVARFRVVMPQEVQPLSEDREKRGDRDSACNSRVGRRREAIVSRAETVSSAEVTTTISQSPRKPVTRRIARTRPSGRADFQRAVTRSAMRMIAIPLASVAIRNGWKIVTRT